MTIGLSVSVEGTVPSPNFSRAVTRSHGRVARMGTRAAFNNLLGHHRSGETIRSFRTRRISDGVEWFDDAPGGFFLEVGTKPHPIFPKNAKTLSWFSPSGGRVFWGGGQHPGQPARPWLAPAIEGNADEMLGIYGYAIEDEWNRG